MEDLKVGLNDDEILHSAYRTLSIWLNESIGLVSEAFPKTPDPNHINALKLKNLVEKYDSEIKRFRDVLSGKIKPHFLMVEIPLERKTMPQAKIKEQERQKDVETIRQGLSILKKRRRPYVRRLFLAKINQFKLAGIISQARQINQQATQIISEIEDYRTKTKSAVNRYHQLQSRFNNLYNKFNSTNLDPTKTSALTFPQKLPITALDFAKNDGLAQGKTQW